ncbi:ThuA domain-containing protein [Streptomyces sp. JH34]|uniref:ThuA domain-containing protein n=1 Tax=Streptomyces sp. JH34 TaxID=2793633 RepID=UPI0023F88965|nr:ThuA domain-containing protein [Streptomyces sp. JH34]MDF6017479.1 ThuA domain-containing protein [Streptomyces sp. JH34]
MSSRPSRSSASPQALPPASIAAVALFALMALVIGAVTVASFPRAPVMSFRVLVYSGAAHGSRETVRAGVDAVRELGARNGFGVEATEDPAVFEDAGLARFQAIVFNNTAGTAEGAAEGDDGLDEQGRAALRNYIRAGGGWVGLHDASAGAGDWDWYEGLVGATLDRSAPVQPGRVEVLDHAHPSTVTLPDLWERTEDRYDWRTAPVTRVHTLAQIRVRDGITGRDEGVGHPWSWCQDYDGGRSWFTAGGHAPSAFRSEGFLAHLLGGIEWAAGAKPGDCTATRAGSFRRTRLATGGPGDPVDVAVAPDRRVFVARRTGELEVVDQRTMRVSRALDFAYGPGTALSDGLIGLALDPGFSENHWLYLLRPDTVGRRLVLSRFTAGQDTVNPASEKRLLTLPGRRAQDGDSLSPTGSLAFDREGRLYAATGDITLPLNAGGPNDLRGAILRITPQDDGTYTVPEGNLFPPGTAGTRPEIYAMGMRNPYRVTVDPVSGTLLAADTRPDGTAGYFRITGAGQIERPFLCSGGVPRGAAACVPRVSGAPDATGPGGITMSGPVYDYDAGSLHRTGFPEYFAGKWLTYEPVGRRFTTLSFQRRARTSAGPRPGTVAAGELQSVDGVFEDMEWNRPTAAVFGADGALYVVDAGRDDGAGDDESAGVFRIDHVGLGRLPGAAVTADRDNGPAPLTVAFTGAGSGLPAGEPVTYAWDFDGDGGTDSTEANPSYTYRAEGRFTARLTVTGPAGTTAVAGQDITVGNTRPRISVQRLPDGGLFRPGDSMDFTVDVRDEEDAGTTPVDCSRILVRSQVGRPGALRPLPRSRGCGGSIVAEAGAVTPGLYRVTVRYTDRGGPKAPELTGSASLTLRTALQEAERFTSTGGAHGGAVAGNRADASGGRTLTEIEDGDWIAFDPVHLRGIRSVTVGATPCGLGGTVEFRDGSPDGPLLGSSRVPGAGLGGGDVSPTTELRIPGGGGRLYVVFTNPAWSSEKPDLFAVDWLRFAGPGAGKPGTG